MDTYVSSVSQKTFKNFDINKETFNGFVFSEIQITLFFSPFL